MAIVVVAVLGESGPHDGDPIDRERAASEARAACQDLEEFRRLIARDEEAPRVLRLLDSAADHATIARRGDVLWVQLWSGTRLLQRAIGDDDPDAARLGLRVVQEACSAVEVPIANPAPEDPEFTPTTVLVP